MSEFCTVPPVGWACTRTPGHDGPCAAEPADERAVRDREVWHSSRPKPDARTFCVGCWWCCRGDRNEAIVTRVTTKAADEMGAWIAMCEALGIKVIDRGCGQFDLIVPPGVAVPDPPSSVDALSRERS